MKIWLSQFSLKSFIAYLITIIFTGFIYIQPLRFPQKQLIVFTGLVGIMAIFQAIFLRKILKRYFVYIIFIPGFAFELFPDYRGFVFAQAIRFIINIYQIIDKNFKLHISQECQQFWYFLFILLIKNITEQPISIVQVIYASFVRFYLFDNQKYISKKRRVIMQIEHYYSKKSIISRFVNELIFFVTFFILNKFEDQSIIIALTLLLATVILVNKIYSYIEQIAYVFLIIQILAIVYLILNDFRQQFTFEFIIILLFISKPINDNFLNTKLRQNWQQQKHSTYQINSFVSTIIAAFIVI